MLWQIWTLYHALGYRVKPAKYILVQNPPSIPTLVICTWTAFFRCSRLVIDWHNFGYSILALKLGPSHLLVRVSKWYEGFFARQASAHLAVTDAMVRVLKADFGVEAKALHDRPATHFKPLSKDAKAQWLKGNASTKEFAQDLEGGSFKLMVSSTSWTADEDFSILLDALCSYSTTVASRPGLPKILAIITGKGPQKEHYLSQIRDLNQQNKLQNVVVSTCWLSVEDYSSILGAADLGVSLHTSSSGVDLPMKVVDMFGAGLPVAAAKFDALPELVKEGINGRSFSTPKDLVDLLVELFSGNGTQLGKLKEGAMEESERRWDDEWVPIAGKLFQLNS
ncbi:MAG: glycosyltransferase [Terriglobus roseus]|nr:glycosyltransferase [Terriglobus roseus]